MELYKFLKIEDLPDEMKVYANNNNIHEIGQFTIEHLFNLYGERGYQFYFKKLTSHRPFMVRIIRERFPNHSAPMLQKELGLSHNHSYSLWKEAHQNSLRKPKGSDGLPKLPRLF